ncbi:hypothetical protein [Rhodococcus sp. ARC_M6]|uniref:hypothetical protein n=1 Tax=Rhodococcus sp. ARC_M6 TaxID=2928852 RepID=UPI001FB445FE|nr:hypothetical protein [Rhodococcus sp. ARC_M6]MCJ0907446.1 hypothetical protein [Rhodococcus sp. ARC_M6]
MTMYPTGEASPFAKGELGYDVSQIDCYAVNDVSLKPHSVLVVASNVDQIHLTRIRDVIRRFLDAGKVVIFNGHLDQDWLPGAQYFEPVLPKTRRLYVVTEVADHPIFEGVDKGHMTERKGVAGFFARGHHPVPEGADILVRLIGGQPVTYIDRVSTAGTILVHATGDLFGYASGLDDNTAARIPKQLAAWALGEAESLQSSQRRTSSHVDDWAPVPTTVGTGTGRGVAAVFGGSSHHHNALTTPKYAEHLTGGLLYLPDLAETDLSGYDGIIIPERIHRGLLNAAAPKILEYLANGGTVVSFSGGEPLPEFLPGVRWDHRPTNYWWWLEEGADMGMSTPNPDHSFFTHLGLKDCTWHFHGAVHPPEGAQTLLTLPNGDVLAYVDQVSTPGTLVVATLDPMSHFGAYFMPATEKFLDGFMPWISGFATNSLRTAP